MVKKPSYLIDTDILISMLRDRGDTTGLRSRALQAGLENCYVSAISVAELYSGAYRMKSERGLHEVNFIKNIFKILPFGFQETDDSEIFGRNKFLLSHSGLPLDDMDLLIGSSAQANGMVMVSHNTKHFSRIAGLVVEDWLQ